MPRMTLLTAFATLMMAGCARQVDVPTAATNVTGEFPNVGGAQAGAAPNSGAGAASTALGNIPPGPSGARTSGIQSGPAFPPSGGGGGSGGSTTSGGGNSGSGSSGGAGGGAGGASGSGGTGGSSGGRS